MKKIIIGIILIAGANIYAQTYNPEKAAEYARFWCDKRNTSIYSPYFDEQRWGGPYNDNVGRDCANFVSQCLKAGGLNLSIGIDPNKRPPQNGVDAKGCMDNAHNLTIHLEHFQNTDVTIVSGNIPPDFHDLGDPMFVLTDKIAIHSYICSLLESSVSDNSAIRLYSSHSSDNCDEDLSNWYPNRSLKFFHIRTSIPPHCDNCVQDADETGIDCGGSCPPCQHAPQNKAYTYDTERRRLPEETYAINNITAGGTNVSVYPGQNVLFVTAGSINLTPGFWARPGSNFKADVKKKLLDATADCNAYCDPIVYNSFTPCLQDGFNDQLIWEFANASRIDVRIYQWKNRYGANMNYLVYTSTIFPEQDGETMLWDLTSGNPQYYSTILHPVYKDGLWYLFDAYVTVTSCQGPTYSYIQTISVNWDGCNQPRSAQQNPDNQNKEDRLTAHYATQYEDNDINYKILNIESVTDNPDYFTLYPNPTSGTLTISSTLPLQAFADLTVSNSSGQIVYGQKSLDSFTLSLPALPSEEYVLSVRIGGVMVSCKVILQR